MEAPASRGPGASPFDWQVRQIKRHSIPSHAEQIALGRAIRAWQDHPDGPNAAPSLLQKRGRRALDRLVSGNLLLVVKAVMGSRPQPGIDACDLLQAGSMALITAATKFDPARGCTFATYAQWWIRQGLQRLKKHQHLIALPQEVAQLAEQAFAIAGRLMAQQGLTPTASAIGDQMGLDPARVRHVVDSAALARCCSLDVSANDEDSNSFRGESHPGLATLDEASPLEVAAASERRERVRNAIASLDPAERKVVLMVDFEGTTYRQAALQLGMHRDSVRKQHHRARHRLGAMLSDLAVA
jgi:RNA polymerase primary sigma factor